MITKGKLWYAALTLIFTASMTIAACSGGGGGGGGSGGTTTGTTQSTTTTINGTSQSVTAAATVTGTGTTGAVGTTGLPIAEKISVVSSSSTKPSVRPLGLDTKGFDAILGAVPAGWTTKQYNTDPQFVYVHERSQDAFKKTNEILCSIGQTKYTDMTNKGSYLALVDGNQCSQNRDSATSAGSSSQNQSSGSAAPSYQKWTILSNRADNSSPQVVSAWVHTDMGNNGPGGQSKPGTVFAKLVVAKTATELPPYGLFTMNFAGYLDSDASKTTPFMKGYLRTVTLADNSVVLQFYNERQEQMGTSGAVVTMKDMSTLSKTSATAGKGEVMFPDDSNWSPTGCAQTKTCTTGSIVYARWRFAYDGISFQRQKVDTTTTNTIAGSAVCLDQSKKESTAWRYGGYWGADFTDSHNVAHPAGSRVELQSGFPIKYTKSGKDYQGYIGYYGMWFPENVLPASGDTVTKFDYSNNTATGTSFTVFKSGGKLMKHTKVSLKLSDIKGVPVQYGSCSGSGGCTQYEAKWDGTSFKNYKSLNQSSGNMLWKNLSTPTAVTANSWDNSFNFWSQALGGDGRVEFPRCSATDVTNSTTTAAISNCSQQGNVRGSLNTTTMAITPVFTGNEVVTFHKSDMVYKGDTSLNGITLACFDNCPDGGNIDTLNKATTPDASTTPPVYANTSWMANQNQNIGNANNQIATTSIASCEIGAQNTSYGAACRPSVTDWSTCMPNQGGGMSCTSTQLNGGFYGYTFDSSAYTLTDKKANKPISLTALLSDTQYDFGLQSGSLMNLADATTLTWTAFNPATGGTSTGSGTILQAITCDWPFRNWGNNPTANDYGTCAWKAWDAANVFYTWETGTSQWNTFQTLTYATASGSNAVGDPLVFDPPLDVFYVHGNVVKDPGNSATTVCDNTGLTVAGDTWKDSAMNLQYNGFGDLWGIPGNCIDPDTGAAADCTQTTRYIPSFTVPDGSCGAFTIKDSSKAQQTVAIYFKALEKEERMATYSGTCTSLTPYDLPDATPYKAPDIGTEPVTTAPSVIGGVIQ